MWAKHGGEPANAATRLCRYNRAEHEKAQALISSLRFKSLSAKPISINSVSSWYQSDQRALMKNPAMIWIAPDRFHENSGKISIANCYCSFLLRNYSEHCAKDRYPSY
jgi:hypothetical protein